MKPRILSLEQDYSFILLGARGTGKSTLIESLFRKKAALWVDLLDPDEEAAFQAHPSLLAERCQALKRGSWVIVDEVQRAPKLLDVAHSFIERQGLLFGFTGSSARKLKRGAANLLAGRAFTYQLFPFSHVELFQDKAHTDQENGLQRYLEWGLLPQTLDFAERENHLRKYLRSYANTYLKEEIQMEQLVRNLPQFRRFLPIAAQMHTKVLNYSKMGREVGCDHTVVANYFDILEETLLGFRLPGFDTSLRKQQTKAPKFYFIDNGIARALASQLELPLKPGTFAYGSAFEAFVIAEVHKLISYRDKDESLSYLRTKDGAEVDLIVQRPSGVHDFIEIKSAATVFPEDLRTLMAFTRGETQARAFVVSQEKQAKKIEHVQCLHWSDFLIRFWKGEL